VFWLHYPVGNIYPNILPHHISSKKIICPPVILLPQNVYPNLPSELVDAQQFLMSSLIWEESLDGIALILLDILA